MLTFAKKLFIKHVIIYFLFTHKYFNDFNPSKEKQVAAKLLYVSVPLSISMPQMHQSICSHGERGKGGRGSFPRNQHIRQHRPFLAKRLCRGNPKAAAEAFSYEIVTQLGCDTCLKLLRSSF